MNVYNKLIIFFLFIFFISTVNSVSFNTCGVDISEPWFVVKDKVGIDILIVDGEGDTYFEGRDHTLNNKNTLDSFEINGNYFNSVTSKFSFFDPNRNNLSNVSGLVINNSLGVIVTKFLGDGSIFTKGKGVYEGSQSACSGDGLYCNGAVSENRDYFCSLSSSKTGACTYNVLSSEDCLTKASVDSDGGVKNFTKGTLTDYVGCGSGSCTSTQYTDFCSGSVLTEYSTNGASFNSGNIDCKSYEQNYCVGNTQVWKTNFGCGVGQCNQGASSFVQFCPVTATGYSAWSCQDSYNSVRTITTYSPVCGSGSCSQTSVDTLEVVPVGAGNYCSGGVSTPLVYGWVGSGFNACSVTCGGGSQSRSVSCIDNLGVSSPGKCNLATKPVLSQACNTQSCSFNACSVNYGYCNGVHHLYYYPSQGGAQNICNTMKSGTTASYTTANGYAGCGGCLTVRGWNGAGWGSGCWANCHVALPYFSSITCSG